jgi:hypothetical protein
MARGGNWFQGGQICSGCGKKCYPSRGDAKKAAKRIHQHKRMRFYHCDPEDLSSPWHMTSQSAGRTANWRAYERRTSNWS